MRELSIAAVEEVGGGYYSQDEAYLYPEFSSGPTSNNNASSTAQQFNPYTQTNVNVGFLQFSSTYSGGTQFFGVSANFGFSSAPISYGVCQGWVNGSPSDQLAGWGWNAQLGGVTTGGNISGSLSGSAPNQVATCINSAWGAQVGAGYTWEAPASTPNGSQGYDVNGGWLSYEWGGSGSWSYGYDNL